MGSWSLSPLGGPYRAVVGDLQVDEYIDGRDDMPWCWVVYSMTGEVVEDERASSCATCDYVFGSVLCEPGRWLQTRRGGRAHRPGGNYDEDDVIETDGIGDCMSLTWGGAGG